MCSICFVENVKVTDVTRSPLQNVYKRITELENILYCVCNICYTKLKHFGIVVKQIDKFQNQKEDNKNNISQLQCQPLVPLSTHIIERASVPYHIAVEQEIHIKIEKEEKALNQEDNSSKPKKLTRTEKNNDKRSKKPKKSRKNNLKLHACDVCDKKYGRSDHLKLHKTCHSYDAKFSCHVCKKKFKRKNTLYEHLKIHTEDKPYSCNVCSKRFHKSSNLKMHKITHTQERPFACDICRRTFNRKSHLTIHQRTHTGNKPYQCNICKNKYKRSDHLRSHQRVHTRD